MNLHLIITKNHINPISTTFIKILGFKIRFKGFETRKNRNITLLAEKKLIDLYAPPSALINDLGEILYIHGRLGKYLEPTQGKARMNIIEMAKKGIKLGLSSAIQNAITNNKEVVFEDLKIDEDVDNLSIKLVVKPLKILRLLRDY